MVFFFGIAAKEITEACLPGGDLNPPSKAINPLLGTLGGVFGPVGTYFLMLHLLYDGHADFDAVANGWGVPTATDIALAWLVARVVFGAKHPAVNFLLLLAVADDAIGLGIIAVFYGDPNNPAAPEYLLYFTVPAMIIAYIMRKKQIMAWFPYILVAGTLSLGGLHHGSPSPRACAGTDRAIPSWSLTRHGHVHGRGRNRSGTPSRPPRTRPQPASQL